MTGRIFNTEAEAIAAAERDAATWADRWECEYENIVALDDGNAMHITAAPDGAISRRVSSGWPINDFLYTSEQSANAMM